MRFADITGQENAAFTLRREIERGRAAHAYLIHGPTGSGHLALAWALASYILCEGPGEDACGACNNCQRVGHLTHPDLHFSFPFMKRSGKTESSEPLQAFWRETIQKNPFLSLNEWLRATGEENKQGVIPVAESEYIVERLNLKAYEGGQKLMLIWMAEKLNPDAANKLLKVLEEPPKDTTFVLMTEDPSAILATIRSRTRLCPLKPLSDEALVANLERWAGIEREAAERIAGPADGNLSSAMEMALQGATSEYFQTFTQWMRTSFKGNIPEGMEWVESIAGKGREWHKNFLLYGLHMLRTSLLHNHVGAEGVRLNEEEREFEDKFRHYIPDEELPGLVELFEKACEDIERNGNPRLIFFDTTLGISRVLRAQVSSKQG